MRVTEVKVPRFNLGNAVTKETMLPRFLDGLGHLLELLPTDSGARHVEGDTRVGTDKLSRELHVPKVNMRLVTRQVAAAPGNPIFTSTYLSSPRWR